MANIAFLVGQDPCPQAIVLHPTCSARANVPTQLKRGGRAPSGWLGPYMAGQYHSSLISHQVLTLLRA